MGLTASGSNGYIGVSQRSSTAHGLEDFHWIDACSLQEVHQDTTTDSVLRALPDCPHLRNTTIMTKSASADAVRNLLHSPRLMVLSLAMNTEHWLVGGDEIRQGRNESGVLALGMVQGTSSEATEAVQAS
jgi:hypothetical protein